MFLRQLQVLINGLGTLPYLALPLSDWLLEGVCVCVCVVGVCVYSMYVLMRMWRIWEAEADNGYVLQSVFFTFFFEAESLTEHGLVD